MDLRLSDIELFRAHCFTNGQRSSLGDLWRDAPLHLRTVGANAVNMASYCC